jgi:arylsulfatase A-like enzyme
MPPGLSRRSDGGRLANTLVIVTSDHGEELFEHGDLGHAHTLYEELLRVPLILRHPQRYAGGARRAHEVFLEDLPATIAELLDLPLPAEWRGILVEEARPRDLLAALRNEQGARAYAGFDAAERKWIHTPEGFYRTPRRCSWELYRLAEDPGEREDRGASLDPAPFAAELERLLAKYALSATLAPPVQPSSALLEQLRAFGYLQGR